MSEVSKGYSLSDAFYFCINKYDKVLTGPNVAKNKKLYRDICVDFNTMVMDNVVEGKIEKLPFGLGKIWIQKYPTSESKTPHIDFNQTKLQGEMVYFSNLHSDGYSCKIRWFRRNLIYQVIYYKFTPSKFNRQRVAKLLYIKDYYKRFRRNL